MADLTGIKLNDKMLALCPVGDPSPIAYMNVYEPDDLWIKVQGCEACPTERREKCCGNCPMLTPDAKCYWNMENKRASSKPFKCVVLPEPSRAKKGCALIFECVRGTHKGKLRHVTDIGGVLR